MDRTLLLLLLLSVVLITAWAPYATLTLSAIVGLSALVTRGAWTVLQGVEPAEAPQRVLD